MEQNTVSVSRCTIHIHARYGTVNNAPQQYPSPNPWNMGMLTLYSESDSVMEVKDLEKARLSWMGRALNVITGVLIREGQSEIKLQSKRRCDYGSRVGKSNSSKPYEHFTLKLCIIRESLE